MRSLLAGWRVSLHRTRADWPIVAAAWLITLLAAVLLAAGAIYPSAASEAGLRRALADTPAVDRNVEVSVYAESAVAITIDGDVQLELAQLIAPLGGMVVRDWRGSATLALPSLPGGQAGDQAVVGYLDGLSDHATLVKGSWPVETSGPAGPIEAVVVDDVAQKLGLEVGDALALVAHPSTQPLTVPARLVGIYAIDDAADPYWNADEQLLTGLHENGQYRTFGPFQTTRDDLLQRAGLTQVRLQWGVLPNFERLTVDGIPQLRGGLGTLEEHLQARTDAAFDVVTGLPSILADAERALLVSRTGVLLVMAQLALLAAYAVVLTATLLVDHRRVETALLRSRGAGSLHVALLALTEGLLIAVPSVIVAPWLAVAALNLLNVVGPLAAVGLRIEPHVTTDGYLAAAVAGIACVALLVLPAGLAARRFAAEQSGLSRQETRTFGQRMGLDVALLAVTAIALWQLRLYGAPLTRTVQGNLGLDPLLVAAPAIGLVAGGVLALRILPLLAQAAETAVTRGRDLVASLGSRQLARRPLRYTRSALLLMLAMSMGVFALSYAATWSTSQRDQAAYQAGAAVRVMPGSSLGTPPAWALPAAYSGLGSLALASPVERLSDGISFPAAAGSADLLALDADTAAGIVLFRADESAVPLGDLMRPLRAGRPEPRLATLPGATTYLRITPVIDIASIVREVYDDETGEVTDIPLDLADLEPIRVSASAIVRDAHGLLYRGSSEIVSMAGSVPQLLVPFQPARDRAADPTQAPAGHLDGPIQLAGLALDVWLPLETLTTRGVIGVAEVAAGLGRTGPWTDVSLTSAGDWRASMSPGREVLGGVPTSNTHGSTVQLGGGGPQELIYGNGSAEVSARLAFVPVAVAPGTAPVPVVVNRAFLESTGSSLGDTISGTLGGGALRISIAGSVDSFPTTDPERPLLILDEPTLGLLRLYESSDIRNADEWWMAPTDGQAEALIDALRASPFDSASVTSAIGRARSLSTDPVALGIIGALSLGFVATGLFALVGLTVSAAVSARQRRTEFALLRALGLSGRQLSNSLWLENGSLVLVSLLGGTALGLLIGWVVLPFVTVTQRATTPIPPVQVHVPWGDIALLDLGSALALGVAVLVIGAVLRRLGVGSILRMGED